MALAYIVEGGGGFLRPSESLLAFLKRVHVEFSTEQDYYLLRFIIDNEQVIEKVTKQNAWELSCCIGSSMTLPAPINRELVDIETLIYRNKVIVYKDSLFNINLGLQIMPEDLQSAEENQSKDPALRRITYDILRVALSQKTLGALRVISSPHVSEDTLLHVLNVIFKEGLDILDLKGAIRNFSMELIPLNPGSTYRFAEATVLGNKIEIELSIL